MIFGALEDIGTDDDALETSQLSTVYANRQPSYVHEPLANSLPQPVLDATLVPPLLSSSSPEPLWLPYFRARLDKLILVLVSTAFQLLSRPRDGTSDVIKPSDLIFHRQLRDDQQRKLHFLRWLVAIVFQEHTLLCISPAGSYESATWDGALISQGRR